MRHGRHCGTRHALLSRGAQKSSSRRRKPSVLHCSPCTPATSSSCCATAGPGRAPSSPTPPAWRARPSPPASTCCMRLDWWRRSAAARSTGGRPPALLRAQPRRPGGGRRRRRRHARPRRHRRPLGRRSSARSARSLDIAEGPEVVLGWVVHDRARAAEGAAPPGQAPGRDRHRPARPGRARDRPPDQPADHAGLGPVRRARARSSATYAVPVLVDNDVNIMALGEQQAHLPDVDDLVLIKVATGIGSGIISGGRLQRGATGHGRRPRPRPGRPAPTT